MVTIVLLSVVILAGLAYRYHSALQVRKADIQAAAVRIAQTLLEGWRSTTTPSSYDPISRYGTQMAISLTGTGPAAPVGYTSLGTYTIVNNRAHYYATLAYRTETTTDPESLTVSVGWKPSGETGDVSTAAQYARLTSYN